VPVLPRLVTTGFGAGDFAVAADGTLVYVDAPGSLAANARTLVWVDRTGNEEPVAAPPHAYLHPRLSPDETRVALASTDQENDLWIWDLRRARLTRLTLDPGEDSFPVWTPDSQRIVFSSTRGGGPPNLWWQAADGTGIAERLTTSGNAQLVTGITPEGTAVVFYEVTPTMGRDLLQVALDGTRRVTPLLQTKFDELTGSSRPTAGGWRTSPTVRDRSKFTSGHFRTSAAASGKPRRRGVDSRSGRGAARNCSTLVAIMRCCACRWRRAARREPPARR